MRAFGQNTLWSVFSGTVGKPSVFYTDVMDIQRSLSTELDEMTEIAKAAGLSITASVKEISADIARGTTNLRVYCKTGRSPFSRISIDVCLGAYNTDQRPFYADLFLQKGLESYWVDKLYPEYGSIRRSHSYHHPNTGMLEARVVKMLGAAINDECKYSIDFGAGGKLSRASAKQDEILQKEWARDAAQTRRDLLGISPPKVESRRGNVVVLNPNHFALR